MLTDLLDSHKLVVGVRLTMLIVEKSVLIQGNGIGLLHLQYFLEQLLPLLRLALLRLERLIICHE